MKQKFLSVFSLVLLQIVIVGNLQPLAANAIYGFSLPFLYICAAIGFFVPCLFMVAELATAYPQTGGAYIWAEKAFGKKAGFFTVTILWFSNLLWYPSIFSLIAANAAYLFDPILAQNKMFVLSFSLILFWSITFLNCMGVQYSTRLSVACAIVGIMMPMLFIIVGGLWWWHSGHPLAISVKDTPLIPDLKHLSNLGYLIAIATSLFGIEVAAVHAGDVKNPKRDFPSSLLISGIILLILLIGTELSIAIVVPANQLSVVTGLLDALQIFFQTAHWQHFLGLIFLLVFIGNVGSITAWMLGSTRGMYVACTYNHVAKFLQKTNSQQSPIGILIFEAVIFTLACSVFLLFPKITDSFWLLLDVASQISLAYYIILFVSVIFLRYRFPAVKGFFTTRNNGVLTIIMGMGILTSLLAIAMGFIAPDDLAPKEVISFHWVMISGLVFALVLPSLFLLLKERNRSLDKRA